MIGSLERKISVDRNRLFQDLIFAKTQVTGLTDSQILRKDLKIIGGIPVAGLPILVEEFIKRSNMEQTLLNFLKMKSDYNLMMLMGLRISGDVIERDLAVFSTVPTTGDRLVEVLVKYDAPSLGLTEVTNYNIRFLRVYKQSNIRMSRKQIAPIIQKVAPILKELHRFPGAKVSSAST